MLPVAEAFTQLQSQSKEFAEKFLLLVGCSATLREIAKVSVVILLLSVYFCARFIWLRKDANLNEEAVVKMRVDRER